MQGCTTELGLPVREDVLLIGFIGRLDHQKGVDLIGESIPWMMGQDVQLVMLGSGRPDLEQMLRQIESQHHDRIRSWVGFSVKTAHRITAGADILLMPSRFEPCGLNQLYAMAYGTIPVVHAVGGLRDTVHPFDPYSDTGLGWTFNRAEAGQLIHALGNCLLTYREYKQSWEGIQRRGMTQDLSWDNAAQNYEEVLCYCQVPVVSFGIGYTLKNMQLFFLDSFSGIEYIQGHMKIQDLFPTFQLRY